MRDLIEQLKVVNRRVDRNSESGVVAEGGVIAEGGVVGVAEGKEEGTWEIM
jgi:hypothetical protein